MIDAFNQIGATSKTTTTGAGTSTTTTTAAALAPSQVDVRILNGVDFTQPIASETAASLKQLGFTITGSANATAEGVSTTEIEYAPGHEAAAQAVASHISGATQLVAESGLSGNDVVLVVGASFTGVSANASSGATTTSGATSTGASSTTTSSTGATTSTGDTTTTTTTPPTAVYSNTQTEPWNPTPCVQ